MDDIKFINPFSDVSYPNYQQQDQADILRQGNLYMSRVNSLSIGVGNKSLYADKEGLRLGSSKMDTARFSVTPEGIVTLRDENDVTIVDAKGFVSTASFRTDGYYSSAIITTTSFPAYTDIAGSEKSFSLSRMTNVRISFSAVVEVYGNALATYYEVGMLLVIDGVQQTETMVRTGLLYATSNISPIIGGCLSFSKTFQLAAGDHTINLAWRSNGNPQGVMRNRSLEYLILGT